MDGKQIIKPVQVNFILNQFNAKVERVINKVIRRGAEDEQPLHAESKVVETETEPPKGLTNTVLRVRQTGWRLDLGKMWKWINANFIDRLSKGYDWFALWRVLFDNNLIEQGQHQVTKFATQMNEWFPKAKIECTAKQSNLFKNGYLGDTPYRLWNKQTFRERRNSPQQTDDGYDRLEMLCLELGEALEEALDDKELRQE